MQTDAYMGGGGEGGLYLLKCMHLVHKSFLIDNVSFKFL